MPIACSSRSLTGSDGTIWFQPAGTEFCLIAADFPVGDDISVPSGADFRVGDPVVFSEEGTATLDTALTAGTTYYVVAVGSGTIQVSATAGGTAITLTGDAAGSDKTNHAKIDYAEYAVVCQVKSFSLDLSREEIDTTTLPCSPDGSAQAQFRTTVAGYASGSGSMEVQFTEDQNSLAQRLLQNSMRKNQSGAQVRLFVNTVYSAGSTVDLANSLYIEAPISILGFSINVTPEDVITASLNFSVSGQPTKLF